jgi:phage-related protein
MTAIGLLAVAMGIFALVMAVSLIPTMWAAAVAGWALMAPFLPIIGIMLAVIAVVGLLWWAFSSNFLGIRDIADNVFGWITNTAFPWFMNGLNNMWEGVKKFGEQVGNVFNGLKNVVGGAMKFVANALIGSWNFQINGINRIINGANKVPGISIPNIPNIPTFAQGVKNFSGGLAMINDGISNEALRVGDVTYLPQGADVINGGATNDLLSRSGGGATTVLSLRDVSTPMIKNWIKENLQVFKQAGIEIS